MAGTNGKFDVCIQNPPYGHTGGNTLHLKFVDKCLEIADKQVAVFPFSFISKSENSANNKYKEKFDKYLEEVDEVDGRLFKDTHMPNVGIYVFDSNKSSKTITINSLQNEYTVNSLTEITNVNDTESDIFNYLESVDSQTIIGDVGRLNKWKRVLAAAEDEDAALNNLVNKKINKAQWVFDEGKCGLCVSRSYPQKARCINSENGRIFTNRQQLFEYTKEKRIGIGFNFLVFNNVKEAQNCKDALQRPLLRLTIYKLQNDQNLTQKVYRYIPAIDWSNSKCKTDEGILEMCGCPKEKAKEYVQYCKEIIDKVDGK